MTNEKVTVADIKNPKKCLDAIIKAWHNEENSWKFREKVTEIIATWLKDDVEKIEKS